MINKIGYALEQFNELLGEFLWFLLAILGLLCGLFAIILCCGLAYFGMWHLWSGGG